MTSAGHGNALAVQKLIHTYARRGAAAVLIEDKIWPRPLGRVGQFDRRPPAPLDQSGGIGDRQPMKFGRRCGPIVGHADLP